MKHASLFVLFVTLIGCSSASQQHPSYQTTFSPPAESKAPKNFAQVIHVFVALCDNVNQGIVPVSASLGNGDDPERNLYWGAAFGVKTFFNKSKDWQPVAITSSSKKSSSVVLDRVAYKNRRANVFLIAEAYRGSYIRQATEDFLSAAAGMPGESLIVSVDGIQVELHLGGSANLIAYAGHDGLMDFQLSSVPKKQNDEQRDAVILACASKSYFANALRATGSKPLLWTTNLIAPEAYIFAAAIDGWLKHETDEQIRVRAAKSYDAYQHCGIKSANALFATGW